MHRWFENREREGRFCLARRERIAPPQILGKRDFPEEVWSRLMAHRGGRAATAAAVAGRVGERSLGSGNLCVKTRRHQTFSEYEASILLLRNCDRYFKRTELMRPHRIFHSINSSVISAHLMSRALDRKMILDDIAKEKFR